MKVIVLVSFFIICSCSNAADPEEIVRQAVRAHQSERLNHAVTEFDFREKHFRIERNNGLFHYQHFYSDSSGRSVVEGITNDSTYQSINGVFQTLTEKQKSSVETSVNSPVYFALLPLWLLDPAVQLTYLSQVTIFNQSFHKILVTFKKEGGGKDFEDRFIFWFDTNDYTMKYFAYTFQSNGGGSRFRVISKTTEISSVSFTEQINYKSSDSALTIQDFDSAFQQNKLVKVSDVILNNIKVVRSE